MGARFGLSLALGMALAAFSSAAALAEPPNLTGTWQIQQTGLNGTTTNTMKITQSGNGVVGVPSKTTAISGMTGTFVNNSQINGKWHGPGGAGWLTIYASPNGHSLNGSWGYNGRKENGTFVANKFLPPSPITSAGTWNVTAAGGSSSAFLGPMTCTQAGPSSICKVNGITINGKFRTKDKVRATWVGPNNRSGWFSYWFNNDNNSFNGVWGYGRETSPPQGRVVGQRALSG